MPKNFQYRGRSVDDLKAMSMDEFINLLPSRMRRSLRRGLSNEQRIILERLRQDNGKPIKTHSRDMVVLPEMIGKTLLVHSGQEFVEVRINEKMLGHYLGEFVITNKLVRHGKPGIGASRSSMYIPLK
ncbi:30S ribosomal protein S19 [Candidatus Bathyarchaeota archaeon RBG_13_52_12]|nr:30S ribosomal protein S19, small subunit ribosomal protein S19 [uncultured archaeon]OGD59960.1 MAG: 30S ribosomal protein S19 [Candidatus Bathyarchaeota archaeon RBG_13_52_12]